MHDNEQNMKYMLSVISMAMGLEPNRLDRYSSRLLSAGMDRKSRYSDDLSKKAFTK